MQWEVRAGGAGRIWLPLFSLKERRTFPKLLANLPREPLARIESQTIPNSIEEETERIAQWTYS